MNLSVKTILCTLSGVAMLSGCPSNPPRNPPADAALGVDQPRADVIAVDDVVSPSDAENPRDAGAQDGGAPVDAGIQVQLSFVSTAIQGSSADGGITVRAQMSWQASIVGTSADGRISVRGVMY